MAARKDNKGRALRKGEFQRAFMEYMEQSPVFVGWLPFFTVLPGTGCRIGEVVGLCWEDVVIDGMAGSIFTSRFGSIHNPQAVNRAIKRIYEAHNAGVTEMTKKEALDNLSANLIFYILHNTR